MQYDQRARRLALAAAPAVASTPARASSACSCVLQGVDSVWDTDVLRPLIDAASSRSPARPTAPTTNDDVQPADPRRARPLDARSSSTTACCRRTRTAATCCGASCAARCATRTCSAPSSSCMPAMVDAAVDDDGRRVSRAAQERRVHHRRHRHARRSASATTLRTGLGHPRRRAGRAARPTCSGADAFKLHDTLGFPLELTQEIAGERGVDVDLAGSTRDGRAAPPGQGRAARPAAPTTTDRAYRELVEQFGPTEFTGCTSTTRPKARVLAVVATSGDETSRSSSTARRSTPSRAARSATPARSRTDIGRGRGARHHVRACPVCVATPRARRAARSSAGQRRCAPIDGERRDAHPPQPHRHPHAALGAARGAGRAREAGGFARRARSAPLRLQPLRSRHPRGDRRRSRNSPTPR